MEGNVIEPMEYEVYVHNVKKYQIHEIGTDAWLNSYETLIKFNHQAIIEAAAYREETVKELFILNDKLEILVHEAYCILVWRSKILPKITFTESDSNSTFIFYSIFYHEATAISMLEILLYHENGCDALNDSIIDLIDYCAQAIVQLIGLTHIKHTSDANYDASKLSTETALEELERQEKRFRFQNWHTMFNNLEFYHQ